MEVALSALISLVVGAVSGFVAAALRSREAIDVQLRANRLDAYERLFSLMARVPAWPPEEGLTYGRVIELEAELRAWYFGAGGLVMSRATRDAYIRLQEGLEARRLAAVAQDLRDAPLASKAPMTAGTLVLEDPKPAPPVHVRGSAENVIDDYDAVQRLCSAVRTEITKDLISRSRPISLRWLFS